MAKSLNLTLHTLFAAQIMDQHSSTNKTPTQFISSDRQLLDDFDSCSQAQSLLLLGHICYKKDSGNLCWAWGQETAAYNLRERKVLSKPIFWREQTQEEIGHPEEAKRDEEEPYMAIIWGQETEAIGCKEMRKTLELIIDYEAALSDLSRTVEDQIAKRGSERVPMSDSSSGAAEKRD